MSNPSFDTVETTLKNLKDVVDRNHSQSAEASQLVEDMENLIAVMKLKTSNKNKSSKIEPPSVVFPASTAVLGATL